jgi:hypothetical protein
MFGSPRLHIWLLFWHLILDPPLTATVDRSVGGVLPFTVPAFTVPAFTVPAFTVPAFTVPAFTVPAFTVPAFTVPAFTVPVLFHNIIICEMVYYLPSQYHF